MISQITPAGKAGHPGQIDGGFGVAGGDEYAARPSAQREYVAGSEQVLGAGRGIESV